MERFVSNIEVALAATGEPFEVIVVDASSDGTAAEVRRLQIERPWLRLLERNGHRETSRSVLEGWEIAQGDVLGCLDANPLQPFDVLTLLAARLRETGADLIVASRYLPRNGNGNAAPPLMKRGAMWGAKLALRGNLRRVSDPTSRFFLVCRPAANLARIPANGHEILPEILVRGNCIRIEELAYEEVTRPPRQDGPKLESTVSATWKLLRQVGLLLIASGEAGRMAKFCLAGATGALINFVGLWAFRHIGRSIPVAAAAASAVAMFDVFAWNELYTFGDIHRVDGSFRSVARRFVKYVGVSLLGIGVNTITTSLCALVMPWPIALTIAIGVVAVWNYFANSGVTWPVTKPGEQPTVAASEAETPVAD